MDAPDVGIEAHWFCEPGLPINQLYGVFGNLTIGRNRGYRQSNDYLLEPANQTYVFRELSIAVRGQASQTVTVRRSNSSVGAFVMQTNGDVAVTLLCPFFGSELRGLNMLAAVFTAKNVTGLMALFGAEYQSNVIHSHLEFGDAAGIYAALNGLSSSLPAGIDRRFPLNHTPMYTLNAPVVASAALPAYYSWNSPFNSELDWGAYYNYGGWWRSTWIGRFFAEQTPSLETVSELPGFMSQACFLSLGGSSQVDRFVEYFLANFTGSLGNSSEEQTVRLLLAGYDGVPFATELSTNFKEAYLFANTWLYQFLNTTFYDLLLGVPSFSIPQATTAPLPSGAPNARLTSLLILAFTEPQLLGFDWLAGNAPVNILQAFQVLLHR